MQEVSIKDKVLSLSQAADKLQIKAMGIKIKE